MDKIKNVRLEVMQTVESRIDDFISKFLVPIEEIWQPTDLLPDPTSEEFMEELRTIQGDAKELSYDFWVVLVGDTVTEEALPTYESWLLDMEGVHKQENGWHKWFRHWTGEENRHGDTLSKYLYLSGRVDMREVEVTTQYLLSDGFDPGTGRDPYKNFIYTTFQELATNISHKRVGKIAKQKGNKLLAKMCNMIAGDEMRHHLAYREFSSIIFEYDPSEMMNAFAYMMRNKIVMPAQLVRQSGQAIGQAFVDFSNAAQRIGVYTSEDYIDILSKLTKHWNIESITGLNEQAEKSRDFILKLPARLTRIAERMTVPKSHVDFSWVQNNGMMAVN